MRFQNAFKESVFEASEAVRLKTFTKVPPGTKPIDAGNFLGELIFARMHAGPVFALARIQETILRRYFPSIVPNS